MNRTTRHPPLSRRHFLKLMAAASATATGGYILYTYAPWLSYDQQTNLTWRSFEPSESTSVCMRELVRYAALAANGHNTQPWKFAIKEKTIEIHPDYTRRLPTVDPKDRELWISL